MRTNRRFTDGLLIIASHDLDDAPQDEYAAENGKRATAVRSAQGQRAAQSTADEDQSNNDVPHGPLDQMSGFRICR